MSTAATARPSPIQAANPFLRPSAKKAMSITQTYYLAHKARAKLSREAAQPDHDLRLLVGHANLLDSLMMELAEAEREQERWFNQSVRGASKTRNSNNNNRHIQWADRVEEEAVDESEEEEVDYDSDSSDSDDSEYDYEDDVVMTGALAVAPAPKRAEQDDDEDDEMGDDLEEDYAQLELVRTPSHSSSPPELVDHESDSSDDEAMPPSPADAELPLLEKEGKHSEQEDQDSSLFEEEDYYVSERTPAGLVSAISVY